MSHDLAAPHARSAHSVLHAEHVQSYHCPGISAQAFQAIPVGGPGAGADSKWGPPHGVVVLQPVVDGVARHGLTDLLARRQNYEGFVAASFVVVLGDAGRYARSDVEVRHARPAALPAWRRPRPSELRRPWQ